MFPENSHSKDVQTKKVVLVNGKLNFPSLGGDFPVDGRHKLIPEFKKKMRKAGENMDIWKQGIEEMELLMKSYTRIQCFFALV